MEIMNHHAKFNTSRSIISFQIKKWTSRFFTVVLFLHSYLCFAQTIYVDKLLPADCVGNYSISNRDCSGSDGDAHRTLQSAAAAALAGTQVLIREGEFNEQLSPQNSGREQLYHF